MPEPLIGLTPTQFDLFGRLVDAGASKTIRSESRPRNNEPQPPVRVIALQDRAYDSMTSSLCPTFRYDPNRMIYTLQFVGSALAGYIVLTVDGQQFTVECRRTDLLDLVRKVPTLLRLTIFPGLWEFDFGSRTTLPTITAASVTTEQAADLCALFDQDTDCIFNGSMIIRREAWGSLPKPANSSQLRANDLTQLVECVSVTDSIPYETGAVGAGAIGQAIWQWDAGYLAHAWQCRQFSFAEGYDQSADPVPVVPAEDETSSGGSGGGGPTGPEEPPGLP